MLLKKKILPYNLMLAIILLTNSMQVGQSANFASILQKLHFFDIDDIDLVS